MSLSACADYLDRRDTITFSAGDAQAWNRAIQTTDPWPPYVMDTRITGDGERVARVIRDYSNGGAANASSPVEFGPMIDRPLADTGAGPN